ncbi:autotransporter domain-containing protein [Zwartia panacis]|uniref:autotransporter family protein n=1 Tax=Zwartia panacis TaxID=2683345 RepID=UPI0025B32837|nr:autotransporter domain-containing protein [Zwartia panacis]MDN4015518.1 autotransporter domain-containing protein [Zwartia panacis]
MTANPVLAGGTLVLTKGERSRQALSILSEGGIISAPTAGAAQLLGQLSGSGRVTFNGSGMTVLSGVNTYTGGTTVESGTLSLLGGTLGSGDVYVAPGAQLVGTGTIPGPVTVAGLFKPGNSPGYINANANVVMTNGSVYQQDIAGTTQASQSSPVGATGYYSYLNITGGQFIINPGSTLTPALSNLFNSEESGYGSTPYTPVIGDRFRIITADGGISGKFSTLTQPAELLSDRQFLPFYNLDGTNSLDLAVIPKSYVSTIAVNSGNQNAQSVGAALDQMVTATQSGTSNSAQDQLLYAGSTQSASNLVSYAQSLAGEVYAAAVAVIAQTTQRVQQAVLTRMGDTMGIGLPNTLTSPAGNTALMEASHAALSGGVPSPAVSSNPSVNPNAEAKRFANGNVWGDLVYQKGHRTSDNYSGGWNSNLYQLVFGSDFLTTHGMTVGGGLALSNTTLNPSYGSGTIQQGAVFAYGKLPVQEYIVDATASFGLNSSDLSRGDVTGLSNGFKNKNISGQDAMISLGVSRPVDIEHVRITPYARVTWQVVMQSGVNEGGAASALSVNSFTGNGVRGVIGIAAGSKANSPMTNPYTYRAYVGVGADSSGVFNPILNASIAGINTSVTTPHAGATFVQAGLYGTAKIAENAYVYLGLSGEARSGQTLGAVNFGVRVQF